MGRVLHDVITITTVGYREVHELSVAGQAFTVLVLIVGVGAALYTFTLMAAGVVEGGLPKRFQRRRAARMLDTIKDHFIICGYGRIGSLVASQFRRQNVPYVVVERDSERQQAALDDGGLAVEADASREEVLKRVGIERARGLIAAVSTDAENVYTVLSARVLRPDLFIIGRAENEDADAEAEARGRGPRDLAVSDRRGADGADGAAARPWSISSSSRRARTTSSWPWRRVTIAADSTFADQSLLSGESPAAVRRHRGRDSAAGRPHGVQPRAGNVHPRGRQAGRSRAPGLAEASRSGG